MIFLALIFPAIVVLCTIAVIYRRNKYKQCMNRGYHRAEMDGCCIDCGKNVFDI